MLRTCIAVSAAVLLFSGLLAASASAQTATAEPVGKPLQILKIIEEPNHPEAKPDAKLAHKSAPKRRVKVAARKKPHGHIVTAGRHRPLVTAHAFNAPATEPSVPAPNPPAPADVAAAAPLPEPVTAPAEQNPSEIVVAGQAVKVMSPDNVNDTDLAADDASTQTNDAAPMAATSPPAMREIVDPQPKSDSMKAAAVEPPKTSSVGSTSWILQVLAALGGAVTAGSVAWFLIGSTPQRTYG
jgi:hypothetical protein